MIANVFQTCLAYDIEVIFNNRFYNCIIKLKCILVIFCVTMNSEIMYKKVICGQRGWLIYHFEILRVDISEFWRECSLMEILMWYWYISVLL